MKANFVQKGEYIDYVPQNDVHAGDVVIQGLLTGIAKLDIKAGELGALATSGIYDVVKDSNTVAVGAIVHWNGTVATASPDNGGTGCDKIRYHPIGKAIAPSSAGDSTVRILLNA